MSISSGDFRPQIGPFEGGTVEGTSKAQAAEAAPMDAANAAVALPPGHHINPQQLKEAAAQVLDRSSLYAGNTQDLAQMVQTIAVVASKLMHNVGPQEGHAALNGLK